MQKEKLQIWKEGIHIKRTVSGELLVCRMKTGWPAYRDEKGMTK